MTRNQNRLIKLMVNKGYVVADAHVIARLPFHKSQVDYF